MPPTNLRVRNETGAVAREEFIRSSDRTYTLQESGFVHSQRRPGNSQQYSDRRIIQREQVPSRDTTRPCSRATYLDKNREL